MTLRGNRLVLPVLVVAFIALAFAVFPGTALAASQSGPAQWSAVTPADGGSVSVPRPAISVSVYDAKGLLGSPYYSMKVDGVAQTPAFAFLAIPGGYDRTRATLSFTPRADLATGTHTVYVSVRDSSQYSTYMWSFSVTYAPKVGTPSPAADSLVGTDGPAISAKVTGAVTGLVQHVVVDGTEVPSAWDSANAIVSASAHGLANDTSHDVTVTVTNSMGNSTSLHWTIAVQIYPAMPVVTSCVACHTAYPMAHPMTNCLACHGPGSPVGEGWNTPAYSEHSPSYLSGLTTPLTCTSCHGAGYATVPALHDLSTPQASYHDSASACAPCHVKSLTTEHFRYGKDCTTCHDSTDPKVVNAIATGSTDCMTCHSDANHEALHQVTSTDTGTCGGCHATTSLTTLHITQQGLTCDACHKSTDARVVNAIAGGQKACTACHDAHPLDTAFCYGCHADPLGTYPGKAIASLVAHTNVTTSSLADTVYPGSGAPAASCANCHGSHDGSTRTSGNTLCYTCHDDAALPAKPATYSYQGQVGYLTSAHGSPSVSSDLQHSVLRSDSPGFAAYESTLAPTPANPGAPLDAGRTAALLSEDASRAITSLAQATGDSDYQTYRFRLPTPSATAAQVVARWSGFGEEMPGYPVKLSIWNRTLSNGAGAWEQLFSGDTALQADIKATEATVSPYADQNGYVWLMASAKNIHDTDIVTPPMTGANAPTYFNVSWTTLGMTDSWVDYGPTAAYGSTAGTSTRSPSHSLTLAVPGPGVYHYRVRSTSRDGDTYTSPDIAVGVPSPTLVPVPDTEIGGPTAIPLSWSQPTTDGAPFSYRVVVRAIPSGNIVWAGTTVDATGTAVTLDQGSYSWDVTPTDKNGVGYGTSVADSFALSYPASSSCPFVYTWDGTGWRFEADNFVAGRLGQQSPTGYSQPTPKDAYVVRTPPALQDGRLQFKMVEERFETDYLDSIKLKAVDVPAGLTVYAEKPVIGKPASYPGVPGVLHTVASLAPPVSAVRMDTGQDISSQIATADGDSTLLNPDPNTVAYQTLDLDLGDVASAPQVKLVMTATSVFPTTPDGAALIATFGPRTKLSVQNTDGTWASIPGTVDALPTPPEFPRPFVFDITSAVRGRTGHVRLTFLYKTYVDAIGVDTSPDATLTVSDVPMASATLSAHGVDGRDGTGDNYSYVYGDPVAAGLQFPGAYTKYGDVTPLLGGIDDKFVIQGQGDMLDLSFTPIADPAPGTTRFYVFDDTGYYKDAKSGLPQQVDPLPFAAMSNYPYGDTESYPTDADHTQYRSDWNTRVVTTSTPSVSAASVDPVKVAADAIGATIGAGERVVAAVLGAPTPAASPAPVEVAYSVQPEGVDNVHRSLNTDFVGLEVTYHASQTAGGACETCHSVHGQIDAATGRELPAATIAREDQLCTGQGQGGCHASASNAVGGVNIAAKFSAGSAPSSHHDVSEADQKATGAALKCSDCHNPHLDNPQRLYSDSKNVANAGPSNLSDYVDSTGNLYVAASAAHDGVPPVIGNVGFDNTGSNVTQPVVSWTTNEPATSYVDWGLTTAYELGSAGYATPQTSHSLSFGPLTLGTTYHWRIRTADALGNVTTSADSTTLPIAGPPAPSLASVTNTSVPVGSYGPVAPTFTWSPVTAPSGNAVQYQVYLPALGSYSSWMSATTFASQWWLYTGTYEWDVRARDAVNIQAVSAWAKGTFDVSADMPPSSSCPFVYTWDGTGWRFEADNFVAGRLGQQSPTGYSQPTPKDAYVVRTPPALQDGRLQFKMVEERFETDYLDSIKLKAVDVPAGLTVYAEKPVIGKPASYPGVPGVLHTVASLAPPVSAVRMDTGQDISSQIATADGDSTLLNPDPNTVAYQTLDLDLGDVASAPQVKLVMTATSVFPTTPDGAALIATFGPRTKLSVQNTDGTWASIPGTVDALPTPPEFPRPFVFDITSAVRGRTGHVRLTFLYKTYVDAIGVDTSPDATLTVSDVPMASATLSAHGVDGRDGTGDDYKYVYGDPVAAGLQFPGAYTKYGDVTPLLGGIDDKFVIQGQGDMLDLSFTPIADPAPGTTRFYVFDDTGYYKDAKSGLPQQVDPLPFAAMSNYPYPDTESYPTDADHTQYRSDWNTRVVTTSTPGVSAASVDPVKVAMEAWDAVVGAVQGLFGGTPASQPAPQPAATPGEQLLAQTMMPAVHYSVNTDSLSLLVTSNTDATTSIAASAGYESASTTMSSVTPSAPGTPVDASKLALASASDGAYWITTLATADRSVNVQVTKFTLSQAQCGSLRSFDIAWSGHGEPTPGYAAGTWLWNFRTKTWDQIGTGDAPIDRSFGIRKFAVSDRFCAACHSGSVPSGVVMPSGIAAVSASWNTTSTGDVHGDRKGTEVGGLASAYSRGSAALSCLECHDSHGSANIYQLNSTIDHVSGIVVGTSNQYQNACAACHTGTAYNWHQGCNDCHSQGHSGEPTLDQTMDCASCHGHGRTFTHSTDMCHGCAPSGEQWSTF